MTSRAATAATLAAALTMTGLSAQARAASPSGGPGQVQAPVPTLGWGTCPSTWGKASAAQPRLGVRFTCAKAKVPLDYRRTNGPTIDLALRRVAATDQKHKVGTLFVNPGGPGGSGVDFMNTAWALFSPQVRAKFDIVSFDPRGVARSTPLVCWSTAQEQTRALAAPVFPDNPRELATATAANHALTAACRRNAGPIINHMATADVARDMDLLRQAVGDSKLTYDGISYGTYLGQTYAAMYPGRIRSMVLDAVVDPRRYAGVDSPAASRAASTFTRLGSDAGTWDTAQQFFALCAKAGPSKCTLAALGDPRTVFARTAANLRRHPIRIPTGGTPVTINYQLLVALTWQDMYQPTTWRSLSTILTVAALATHSAAPRSMPRGVTRSHLEAAAVRALATTPATQTTEGRTGVVCTDGENPTTDAAYYTAGKRRDAGPARYFGSPWSWIASACATWPGRDTARYTGPFTTRTSAPVLIVGTTHDAATPYAGAVAAQHNLPGSRLLTYSGWGHPAIDKSGCVADRVSRYILSGALPAAGTVCSPTRSPFDTPAAAGTTGSAVQAARREAGSIIARSSTLVP